MKRAVHAATSGERGVGGVYDRVDAECRDVGLDDFDHAITRTG
jgi:hypothetical protein